MTERDRVVEAAEGQIWIAEHSYMRDRFKVVRLGKVMKTFAEMQEFHAPRGEWSDPSRRKKNSLIVKLDDGVDHHSVAEELSRIANDFWDSQRAAKQKLLADVMSLRSQSRRGDHMKGSTNDQ